MRIGSYSVELREDRVEISRDGRPVASGRWYAGGIRERSGELTAVNEDAEWSAIETALRIEAETFVAANAANAYDVRGVDVTQIDRMLSLTPRERLEVLERNVRSLLQLVPDAPRD